MCRPDEIKDQQTPSSSGTQSSQLHNKNNNNDKKNHEQPEHHHQHQQHEHLQHGFSWGAASLAFWLLATSIGMPYNQHKRNAVGCDNLCQGSLNATRSALTLVGATFLGRLSDSGNSGSETGSSESRSSGSASHRRRLFLYIGLAATAVSLVATAHATTASQLWHAQWPAVLQQNSSIVRALFADYHTALRSTPSQRAHTAGLLGMMGGLAMMLGPALGSWLFQNVQQATFLSLLVLVLAAGCVAMTPAAPPLSSSSRLSNAEQEKKDEGEKKKNTNNATNNKNSNNDDKPFLLSRLWSMIDVPAARSPPALFLLTCRLLNTLSFHIFSTLSVPSLKQRFDFGPTEYGQFFSLIGFFFAASQYLAKFVLSSSSSSSSSSQQQQHRRYTFCAAVAVVGIGRYLALHTTQLWSMYLYYAVAVLATGIISTIFGADTSTVAPPGQAGAFFGLVTTIESGSGIVGPLLGGSLAKLQLFGGASLSASSIPLAPLMASSGLTAVVFAMVWFGYEPLVLNSTSSSTIWSTSTATDDAKKTD